ncbi:hypothetical protein [Thermomonospora umbrina]|uniref:Uncharacterized protein n=1 Tax=Thermomonospora umbrina TaxID=111806 RepID=A0A3D9SP66_9ACTN|nr:hypothetical protein [Thermomonospora umbrina]REE97417.1 hypothetical protein DFJ69_2888 [Thermomonospora umbrina]
MEWLAPLGALLGVVVGIGGTGWTERARWKRSQQHESSQVRRGIYVQFLAASAHAHSAVWSAARPEHRSDEATRRVGILEAFGPAELYARRFDLMLAAPSSVIEPALLTFRRLREVRDVLANGGQVDDPEFKVINQGYYEAFQDTVIAMRRDIGTPDIDVPLFTPRTNDQAPPTQR